MIRQKSSLLISLGIHAALLITLFFAYKTYSSIEKKEELNKVCLKLCNVEHNQQPPQQTESKKIEKIQETIEQKQKEIKPFVALKKAEIAEPKTQEIERVKEMVHEELPIAKDVVLEQKVVQKEHFEIQKDNPPPKQEELSKEYIEVNTQKIAQLIKDNLSYPISARRRGITGTVVVKFCLSTDAKVSDIKIVDSSSEILSSAAIKTIEDLSQKFPKPSREISLSIPINYNLN
ncbi:MAG: TonB family protein [Sulfurimonas sp.]|uniref:energy transducer TonB n=1 Tax=Sulfurimonas sp. TaxID=2022749 RepID=UPI002626D9AB|nr:TonB family protein [Sulfurimonas sp.]MDD5400265.1 TonB family protein [Sulfurimonas sp.]